MKAEIKVPLIGKGGMPITFESTELIRELKRDIKESGKDKVYAVFLKNYPEYEVEVITNYDFIIEEMPITKYELKQGERIALMSADVLLERLQEQNN